MQFVLIKLDTKFTNIHFNEPACLLFESHALFTVEHLYSHISSVSSSHLSLLRLRLRLRLRERKGVLLNSNKSRHQLLSLGEHKSGR